MIIQLVLKLVDLKINVMSKKKVKLLSSKYFANITKAIKVMVPEQVHHLNQIFKKFQIPQNKTILIKKILIKICN